MIVAVNCDGRSLEKAQHNVLIQKQKKKEWMIIPNSGAVN